jgi:hypothetical protein
MVSSWFRAEDRAMSIAFSCVSCDAPLSVRDDLAGRRLRCTNCGSSNTVPELDQTEASEPIGRASIRRMNSGVAFFYRALVVGGILVFVLTAFTATVLIAGSGQPEPAEEVLVGGVKTTNGVIGKNSKIKEPRPVLGKVHRVTLKKGQAYVIDQESNELDSFLILVDGHGKIVSEDDDGGGNFNARILFRPAETGEYRIVATSFKGRETGAYKLTIREDDGKAALVGPNIPAPMPPIAQPNFGGPPMLPKELPPQLRAPTPVKLDNGKLELTDTLQQTDTFLHQPNQFGFGKTYELDLRNDRSYRVDMTSNQLDSYLMILDAGGRNVLAQDDDGGGNLNARIFFAPPAAGKYRIICTSFSKHDLGQFVLAVVEEPRLGGFAQPPEFKAPTTPVDLVDGKLEVKARIGAADRLTNVGFSFGKIYEMDLTANRTYRIELEFDGPGKVPTKTPRLTVQSVDNPPIVLDSANGNGRTVQLSFTPTETARHQIIATSTTGRSFGPITLRVTEEPR